MISKVLLILALVNILISDLVAGYIELPVPNEALDNNLYEEVIDSELCHEQIRFIRSNSLLTMFFADAGIRVPRGILEGNTNDLGNYHQCLGLNQQLSNSELQGKYCMIRVPMNQSYNLPDWLPNEASNFDPNLLRLDEDLVKNLKGYNDIKNGMLAMNGEFDKNRSPSENPLSALNFNLAVCIPKPCTTEQAITSFLFNVSEIGFQYTDQFCRLPDDKPWVPGDTVAVVVFSTIGILTILCTSYDVWQTLILKNDPKSVSAIGKIFSVYTNGRRITNFASSPDAVQCLDGIRAFAMAWVLLGHSYTSEMSWANPLASVTWMRSWQAVWVTGAHITVDTFFMLSGFLVVYTTVGKLNGGQLIRNIHLFWLNRLLRMFPLLATAALIEATVLNRLSDGPIWSTIAGQVARCRTFWWSTLLHIQNFMNPHSTCVGQTWYLAIDVQLHILSPIILYWVLLGKKKIAWIALSVGLVGILVASTTYNYIKAFPSTTMVPSRADRTRDYLFNYYVNTLTRASPFFVGMLFGYIVRTKTLEMSKIRTTCFWIFVVSLSTFIMYSNYPIAQVTWDNQTADTIFNSFARPAWAMCLGLVVYACQNGYGGPVNWFLSHSMWKIHSRLSYAMYLFHFMQMTIMNFRAIAPMYFSVRAITFKFLAHYTLTFAISFFMVLVIDAPFSTIFKLILGGGIKKSIKKDEEKSTKENEKRV